MSTTDPTRWLLLSPPLGEDWSAQSLFLNHSERLSDRTDDLDNDQVQHLLDDVLRRSRNSVHSTVLHAAISVVTDLARQGWAIRVTKAGAVEVQRPKEEQFHPSREKNRIREQELIKRNEQLAEAAVRKFVEGMEKTVLHKDQPVSVFSLFRDGQELASALRRARSSSESTQLKELRKAVDPYLQFVDKRTTCEHTGLRLQDIWRYFRHTWTNQYTSKPGRSMAILVRDRAREFHPIVGIAAIGSPIVQIRERDAWIGWDGDGFLANAMETPTVELGQWLYKTVNSAINGIWFEDFLEEQVIGRNDVRNPTPVTITRLKAYGKTQRELHRRFAQSRELKGGSLKSHGDEKELWKLRTQSHLYRSKRALTLASMLEARQYLDTALGECPTAESVCALLESRQGRHIIRKVLRKAKADRIGIAVADITVCGAVDPYREILGGKLVSMLASSPLVIVAYRERYANQESEIASSMAGRPVVRPSHLVLLGTTSLYGVGSSQYNRLRMRADQLGGRAGDYLEYRRIGKSEAYGTSHFSEETVKALVTLVQQSSNGRRVTNLFGEGVSPKFRKIREGLEVLGFPVDQLLQHGRRRIVYGIPLIRNMKEFLVGEDDEPDYLFDLENPEAGTKKIVNWWMNRWLSKRVLSDDILARLEKHTLIRPIRHGARVTLPQLNDGQRFLFDEFDP